MPFLDRVFASVWPVWVSREMEAMDSAYSQCLVARPLAVARAHEEVGTQAASGYRALGSSSDPQTIVCSAQSVWRWQQQDVCIPRRIRAIIGGVWL